VRLSLRFLAVLLLTWLAGCGGSAPTAPTASPQPTSYLLSGTVFETLAGVARPLAGEGLNLYIHETEGLPAGLTLRGSWQWVTTDQNGRYTAQVPKSRVFVSAWGKRQPCLANASVSRDTIIDVQVVTGSSATPNATAGPTITGFVYETTPDGRKPLRGAEAWLDLGQDAYVANTETDEAGRFFFCGVNTRVRMDVFATGYEPYQHSELISGTADRSFEFEFRR
jgi:hypothetical protein